MAADTLYEGPREGVRRQVFVPNWGKGGVAFYVRTRDAHGFGLRRAAQRGEEAGRVHAGVRDEDAGRPARPDADDGASDRAALGRLRAAGDAARIRSDCTV